MSPVAVQAFDKAWRALPDHQRLIRRRGVTPLMYQYVAMCSIVYDRSGLAWARLLPGQKYQRPKTRLGLPSFTPATDRAP